MRHLPAILVATLVAFVLLGGVAVYAYDASNEDRIADGVTIGGVDVGGKSANVARAMVRRQVAAPLERPLTVTHRGRRFTLSPSRAHVRTDVGGMVSEALERSREGNVLSRSMRDLTGGDVDASVPTKVSYAKGAVAAFVRRVKRSVDRPAKDATVSPSASGLARVKGRNGRSLRDGALASSIRRELVSPSGQRVIAARTKVTRPEVTTSELEDRYPHYLIVDRGSFKLHYYRRLKLVKSYTVAVGQAGFDTPAGIYQIQNKAVNAAWSVPNKPWAGELAGRVIPGGSPENPLKARWMGIADGAGIHGTDQTGSLGTRASHGCVRMAIPEVIELYDRVPVQTPVYIG